MSAPCHGSARLWRQTSRRTALLLAVLLLAPLQAALAQATPDTGAPITVRIDPPTGEVGMLFDIELSVSGAEAADCALVEVPEVDGGRLTRLGGASMSQSHQVVNGRATTSIRTSWRIRFVPERAGRITIPPFRLSCRGVDRLSRAVSVDVAPSTLPTDSVALELRTTSDALWAGQTFAIDVVVSLDESLTERVLSNGYELDLPWISGLPGLMLIETPAPTGQTVGVALAGTDSRVELRVSRSADAGPPRLLLRRSFLLMATRAGELRLPAARFSATVATAVRRERDPLSIFGGERLVATSAAVVDAHAPERLLTVHTPPEEGRPPGYTNAVGRMQLAATAAPTRLAVGQTCTLVLLLTGEGNLDFVDWPAFDTVLGDFRIFGKQESRVNGGRRLQLEISPKTERVREIPRLPFASFDPVRGLYEDLGAGPFALEVVPGGSDGLVTLQAPTETLSSLETIRETLPEPAGAALPAWLLLLPGLAALAGAEWTVRRRRWTAANTTLLRQRSAARRLDQALAAAGSVRDVSVAFGKYLSDRFDGPPAGLAASDAAARLSDASLAAELLAQNERLERAFLGGRRGEVDTQQAAAAARALAGRLEAAR